MEKGFQVFEIGPTGGKHSVSKVYPTRLGAKRARNRIHRECPYFKHIFEPVL